MKEELKRIMMVKNLKNLEELVEYKPKLITKIDLDDCDGDKELLTKLQSYSIKKDARYINEFKPVNDDIVMESLNIMPSNIENICNKELSVELKERIIRFNPRSVAYMREVTPSLFKLALELDYNVLYHMTYLDFLSTEDLVNLIESRPKDIKYILNKLEIETINCEGVIDIVKQVSPICLLTNNDFELTKEKQDEIFSYMSEKNLIDEDILMMSDRFIRNHINIDFNPFIKRAVLIKLEDRTDEETKILNNIIKEHPGDYIDRELFKIYIPDDIEIVKLLIEQLNFMGETAYEDDEYQYGCCLDTEDYLLQSMRLSKKLLELI